MMSAALRAAGLQLRAADPAAMKDFLVAVHARAAEAAQQGAMSSRAEVGLLQDSSTYYSADDVHLRDAKAAQQGDTSARAEAGLLLWHLEHVSQIVSSCTCAPPRPHSRAP